MALRNPPIAPMARTPFPAMAKSAPAAAAVPPRHTTPGTQPVSKKGGPMPAHPQLVPPARRDPHHRATILAKSKTNKPKTVIPAPTFSGRAKPQTEY